VLILASEALAPGALTRRELSRSHRKVFRNVYCPREAELSAKDVAVAAWMWSGRTATVAGASAAALLGSRWLPPDGPAELARTGYRSPSGIVVHTGSVADDEVLPLRGIACTTPARTAYDLGRRLPMPLSLIRVDALMHATGVTVAEITAVAKRYPGARNIRRLRAMLGMADGGAESPQESRVRLLLVRAGLPRPVTQIPITDGYGRVVRRIDMGWPHWKVGVEYDGAQHWTDPHQHADDIDRLEFFADLGWRMVRVSSRHLRFDPQNVACRAADALRAAGWPG
jgi:hypothetical protein